MAWVRFTADFDFKPKPSVTLAFLAGQERSVTRECAALAVERGKAVRLRKPSKDAKPVEVDDDPGRRQE
ncbi:hypothetical protein [Mesorhizobium sp. IMUNJ 23232]|uniref:hypothetical protein n=1 Tax=Mesorhizobium sp. IMUNJ 23232 TaxID=3376064 RepID=UPI00379F9F1D